MTGELMIKRLLQDSFSKPREAAQEVIAINLSYDAIFSLFLGYGLRQHRFDVHH